MRKPCHHFRRACALSCFRFMQSNWLRKDIHFQESSACLVSIQNFSLSCVICHSACRAYIRTKRCKIGEIGV